MGKTRVESWKAVDSGRALANASASRTGSWKSMFVYDADGDYYEFAIAKAWMGTGPMCNIYVYDAFTGAELAQGRHRTEKEAWAQALRRLASRGYPITV